MIVIAIATGAIGVFQTYISNEVGQQVMHDLRAAVYRHLQRLSLAFFTRTRTGEVQSRIANDIGGRRQRRHHDRDLGRAERDDGDRRRRRDVPARLALARVLARLVPLFVLLTRRVGRERRTITTEQQGRLADISSLVAESLSVSGIMLGKTMGRGERARRALHRRVRASSPASRCARGWRAAG